MHHREVAGLMTALAPIIGDFVSKAMGPLKEENSRLSSRLVEMQKRIDEFKAAPPPDEGLIIRLVEETVAKIPPTPAAEVDTVEVERLVSEKVDAAVAAMPPAKPGKNADPEDVLRMVQEEVAKLPPAAPGKDADPEVVAELVKQAVAALPPAKDGEPGKSVSVEDLAPLVAHEVSVAVAALPPPEAGPKGDPGSDGKSIEIGDVLPAIAECVARAIEALPPAKDGAAGPPGERGKDADPAAVDAAVERAVASAVARLPVAKDGRDGRDASDLQVIAKMIGEQLAEQFGSLISNMKFASEDDGRTLVFEASLDSASFRQEVKTAMPLDLGVWTEKAYSKGDGVTWGGSFFIARRDTVAGEKPGVADAWRLSIKRGRDGRDGKDGKPGVNGKDGAPGKNGRDGF